ncbi:beta-1,6-N-acetylglucosaminyltransferase [Rhodocytophaga aerolata]|uniref:Peptide O-xylosyltransferase n=1 Tax=Rhodocytophaga aerolata TaxID=455078 RepID=A0ABT8RG71_9BACT|nr:beta-1,6-N-acetylglucosaminyltransferase [Rhodocytophaga aerolata]MDO1450143.1 beta-1,6-N-acetylglucosaminyltransferase [Rhodocytophaga aerolata]
MKLLYLILAHKEPSQIIRLVKTLTAQQDYVIIHYNKDSSLEEYKQLSDALQSNLCVFFTDRIKTAWGHFSLIQAIINGLKKAQALELSYDHAIILSGQDYPIKSNAEIKRFLAAHPKKLFYTHFEITDDLGTNKKYVHPINDRVTTRPQNHRIDSYYLLLKDRKYLLLPGEMNSKSISLRARFTNKLKGFMRYVIKRKFPEGYKPYFGATFGMITAEFANYLLEFYDGQKAFNQYMKYAFCADEMYLVTVAMNHPYFASKMVNTNMIFSIWTDNEGFQPVMLTSRHLDQIMNSRKLFARKFDIWVDAHVLNMIDEKVTTSPHLTASIETSEK